ncbi:MAG TPA: ABC transporter ATP-binding protein [Longimicrobiaceae bacterium]|jgi:ABC-type multidrug transport system fused ATPase/permease subunit|nr:ABC transporter ATP-binding protein [Longimicrobiaceae bacterium]
MSGLLNVAGAVSRADETPHVSKLFLRFWRDFLRAYRGKFAWVGTLMVLSVLLQLPAPLFTMYVVDAAVAGAKLDRITLISLAFAALVLLRHVFAFVNERATLVLKENIILDLASHLVEHLHGLPLSFFSQHHSSYLQARVMNDARGIEGALVRTLVTVVINGLTFLVGLGFVLYVRVELAVILVLFVVPFAWIRHAANRQMRVLSADMQEKQAVASAAVAESFAAVRTIKAYGRERLQQRAVADRLRDLRDIYVRVNWFGIVSTVGTSLVTGLCSVFVLWYGARAVVLGQMTMGQVVAVLAFLSFLYAPVNAVIAANLNVQQSAAAIQRLYEFLGEPRERTGGGELPPLRGTIEMRGVRFAYADGSEVLAGVDLRIEAGSTVALVGRSGAGKSTLVNLLARFYEPGGGQVLLDGADVRTLALEPLRAAVGIVDQQTFLFSGTVGDNVRFGRPEASDAEVEEACRRSFAHDFIAQLPEGYATTVGERGVRLSGGQCQRIALARMFLKDPPVLILDEAVSAVDSESEAEIHDALVPLMRGRTTVVIAHRLSSLLLADEVLLLDEGRIVEKGSHAELVERNGLYARIFREQFKPQALSHLPADRSLTPA